MRILVLTSLWFPDSLGGVARVATETARHLALRGHEVTVVAPRASAQSPDGLDVRRVLPRTRLPTTLTDIVATAAAVRRMKRGWDLVVAHQPSTAAGFVLAGVDVPLAIVYHASVPRENRFLRERLTRGAVRASTYLLDPLLVRAERAAIRRAARILVLSEFTRGLLEVDHPSSLPRVVNVWGGVDTEQFAPAAGARGRIGVEADETLLLTVRRLDVRMGLEHLLEAVADLNRSRPVSLAIAGKGMLEQPLRALTARLGLDNRVRFLGGVPDAELLDWYRAADAFVLPTVAYEGFGIATAEALACGTPVVGTPVGATPELLRPLDERLVTDDASSTAIAEGIARVLALAGPDLGERCRRYALERLSWPSTIVRWETALREASAGDALG